MIVALAIGWLPTPCLSAAHAVDQPRAGPGWKVLMGSHECSLHSTTGGNFSVELTETTGEARLFLRRRTGHDLQFRKTQVILSPSLGTFGKGSTGMWTPSGLIVANLEPAFLDKLSSANRLTVTVESKTAFDYAVPAAASAVGLLRSCHEQLLRTWGVDTALLRGLSKKPQPTGEPWFTSLDLPEAYVTRGGQAVVGYIVQADGRISSCRVLVSSGWFAFDKAFCDAMTAKARFTPALDSAGKPVPAPAVSSTLRLVY